MRGLHVLPQDCWIWGEGLLARKYQRVKKRRHFWEFGKRSVFRSKTDARLLYRLAWHCSPKLLGLLSIFFISIFFKIFGCAGSLLLHRLLIMVTSLVEEHGLWGTWALAAMSSGLSCSSAHGIFPDQGSNPCLLHWQMDYLPLSHQGSPVLSFLKNLLQHYFILLNGCTV